MRIGCSVCAVWLLGALVPGCTEENPAYCDPQVTACPTGGGPGSEPDLRAPPAEGEPDLRPPPPVPDLRGPPPDLAPACRQGSDCASKICQPDGSCATEVVYGNNRGGLCGGTHAGTLGDPVCTTTAAAELIKRTGAKHLYLFGSTVAYEAVQFDGAALTIMGPGAGASPTARIEGRGGPAVILKGGGTLVLDGLDLGSASAEVISCQAEGGTPELRLVGSLVHDGQASGLYGQGCKLTVQKSAFYTNGNRGVNSENGDVLIENSLFVYNRGGAVRLSGAAGRVRFSTLAYNGLAGSYGGVECSTSGGAKTIEASIVAFNGRPTGGSQLSSGCRLQKSAIDESGGNTTDENRYKAAPDFVSATDFHLRRTGPSNSCCIDQLAAGAGVSDVLSDFEGTARPQGSRWDIGADEVK